MLFYNFSELRYDIFAPFSKRNFYFPTAQLLRLAPIQLQHPRICHDFKKYSCIAQIRRIQANGHIVITIT